MKIGLHYSFQVASDESAVRVIEAGLEDIRWADDNGFSSVVFAEHHFLDDGWLPRPMMLAAAAAAVTRRMRVGSDIVILPLHHPVAVAEEAAVLDVMSGGRALLGVGLGWIEAEFDGFGVPYRRRARVYQRSIEIVRALLAGETVDDDGHYRLTGARVRPLPVNPAGIPFWMGALEDAGVRRVARSGDAWIMPPGNRLQRLVEQRRLLDETREEAGLSPVAEQPLRREAFVAETDQAAWELFLPGLRHEYGVVYRPLHPTYPENDTLEALRKWGEDLFLVGSPETVAAELRRYEDELGATECLIRFQLPRVSQEAVREEAGLAPVAEQPLRREAFVAETDQAAWELFVPGLRHEYGVVYRPLHPTYPENDTLEALRKWGEDLFLVGSPETVAAELRRYEDELGATECLIRFQLPRVSQEAVREALIGFKEVIGLLA